MVKAAAAYGLMVWLAMSLVIIPVLSQRSPAINARWWNQRAGHFPFVGIPIVTSVGH